MRRESNRPRRGEEQLRRELSELIRHNIKEPGLGLLSIAEVKITSDLSQARVYITLLEDDPEVIDFSMRTLTAHTNKLRGFLGKRMHIRAVPTLEFIYDDLIQKGTELGHLIGQAVDKDRQKASDYGTELDVEDSEEGDMKDIQEEDHG
jgi:ribosome-binding factor A